MAYQSTDEPPLLGEIAHLRCGVVRHPIIFTPTGWRFCRTPETIDPALVERDEVCTRPKGRRPPTLHGDPIPGYRPDGHEDV